MTIRIALDVMGGDRAPGAPVEGAVMALEQHPDCAFTLVGQPEVIEAELARIGADRGRFVIHPAREVVGMAEKPSVALRTKKDSSMRVGANLVKSGEVAAFVSSGNTGALMATARYVLKTLPGVDRPAIVALMPSVTGQTLMLDVGANVDCTSDHLCQFALMGRIYASAVMGVAKPRVGLLNIGEEEIKGNEVVKEAGERLKHGANPWFIGNVEADEIFSGGVDVVVCDGFVGNVALKTIEGMARMLTHFLKDAFSESIWTKMGYLAAKPAMTTFRSRVDPRKYNGAILLGLNGIVVKSHGSADPYAFSRAIGVAVGLAANRVNEKIRREIALLAELDHQGAKEE
ncbi:MAG: phosphate acyltransferase PlsX [Magnetococcales bacterium]|nr:phosphate acyltransferase PlsX [Magnetococcales bacterium]NGZ04934.1 phosphate acyltransferase PlsX [Magnetococcales bacterium]